MIKERVFKSFDDNLSLELQLSQRVAEQLQLAVDKRGQACLVVSGGSTPKNLFKLLSKKAIDWSRIYITLADERWVENTHADSNEWLVKKYLLQHYAAQAKFIALKNGLATPELGCQMTAEQLNHVISFFDVVLLGMGNDGHTCSWFPCSDELSQVFTSEEPCIAVNPKQAPYPRLSLTKSTILSSKQIYLHLVGQQKLVTYRQALSDNNYNEMPIRVILDQHHTPVDVYWSKDL